MVTRVISTLTKVIVICSYIYSYSLTALLTKSPDPLSKAGTLHPHAGADEGAGHLPREAPAAHPGRGVSLPRSPVVGFRV